MEIAPEAGHIGGRLEGLLAAGLLILFTRRWDVQCGS